VNLEGLVWMAFLDRQGLKVIVAPLDHQDCLELQDSLGVMGRKVCSRLKYQIVVLFLHISVPLSFQAQFNQLLLYVLFSTKHPL
jgi:hypothetical protein